MLRSILISPDATIRQGIVTRAGPADLVLQRIFEHYLSAEELTRVLRVYLPQVLLFDIATSLEQLTLIAGCARQFPQIVPVALHRSCEPEVLLKAIHSGVRECLFFPFEETVFLQAVARLSDLAREEPPAPAAAGRLYAFVPAKPGCGASTVAVNTALNLARGKQGKVLLADLDLDNGTCHFLLKQQGNHCIFDALERVSELESLWATIVPHAGVLDVLGSAILRDRPLAEASRVRMLIDFVRRLYNVVLVDTSGALDAVTLEVLRQAERILLVCQPDLASAYLAKEKLRVLRSHELEERVSVILNRWRRGSSLRMVDFEAMLGVPVEQTLPDASPEVQKAVLSGAGVNPFSPLGRELLQLIHLFSDAIPTGVETQRSRQIEHFAVVPARYALLPAHK